MSKLQKKIIIIILSFIFAILFINSKSLAAITLNKQELNSVSDFANFLSPSNDNEKKNKEAYFNADPKYLIGKDTTSWETQDTAFSICWHISSLDPTNCTRTVKNIVDIKSDGTITIYGGTHSDRNISKTLDKPTDKVTGSQIIEYYNVVCDDKNESSWSLRTGFLFAFRDNMKKYEAYINQRIYTYWR